MNAETTRLRAAISASAFPLLAITSAILVTSCTSNEELERRLDRRTEAYSNLQERRKLRNEATDARYNAWYDRIME